VDYWVLDPEVSADWVDQLPVVKSMLLPSTELRFADRRIDLTQTFFQEWGVDFTAAELEDFVEAAIFDTPMWDSWSRGAEASDDALTVNVRRGDYYSDPKFRAMFGFDNLSFIERAIGEVVEEGGRPQKIRVVSDDLLWCRANLGGLLTHHASDVVFLGPEAGILTNFLAVVSARRLIITNSTFSYWAAYASNVLHRDNRAQVWAPALHSRAIRGGRPWQHDPGWRTVAVDDIAASGAQVTQGSIHE
jgi:hypothetical protein